SPAALQTGTTYYWRVRGHSGLSTWSAPFAVRVDTVPPAASFASLDSAGQPVAASAVNDLLHGVTVQLQLHDPVSGLAGPFTVQVSTDAGATWTTVASTEPASPPYRVLPSTGATTPQLLEVRGLELALSTNTDACAGPPCGATDQVRFLVADIAGSSYTAG